jgi:DNA helicase-2/ATP-dependent DNA helicase PcrA
MLSETNLKKIYKGFYTWLERPEMFKSAAKGALEYADVFPLVYMKIMLDSTNPRNGIKHVVVDEMQDYTPVQYQVLAELFVCKKTVLGDRNQSVNPLSASSAEAIQTVLPDSQCAYMNKSYRSSFEITEVAQAIVHNPDLAPIERHGEKPQVQKFGTKKQETDFVLEAVSGFTGSDMNSMGIICKTQRQADQLYEVLGDQADVQLLHAESKMFSGGVMISTAYLAKGLEFDEVLVPFCSAKEYQSPIDRHMLYVAVTRAMHRLTMTHTGEVSPFLESL